MIQIHHRTTNSSKFFLILIPGVCAFPVRTHENGICTKFLHGTDLLHICLWHYLIYIADGLNDSHSLLLVDDGVLLLALIAKLVSCNAHNEGFTLFLGSSEDIQMTNMEHIKYTCGVTDFIFLHFEL